MEIADFDGEWADYVRIHNAAWPEYSNTVEEAVAEERTRTDGRFQRRMLARVEGTVVGYGWIGYAFSAHREGLFWMEWAVHPDARGNGVGAALYKTLWAEVDRHHISEVKAETREHYPVACGMLERRGFVQKHREPVSKLALADVDLARFAPVVERVWSSYRLISLAELQAEDPDGWLERLWRLHLATRTDIPGLEGIEEVPLESFAKRQEIPGFHAEACFLAVDGDELVGVTELFVPASEPEALRVSYTATLRAHRRRGIALALKVRSLEYAVASGARSVSTDNEENNPMYQINLKLGFVPQPAWLSYAWTR